MSKASARKRRKPARDRQLEQFERRDLGRDILASGGPVQVIRPKSLPTSVLLPRDLVEKLRAKGKKRGLGYQTMMKMIVMEHVDEY
jgi:uncharacterized protein (DUF4415 family)